MHKMDFFAREPNDAWRPSTRQSPHSDPATTAGAMSIAFFFGLNPFKESVQPPGVEKRNT